MGWAAVCRTSLVTLVVTASTGAWTSQGGRSEESWSAAGCAGSRAFGNVPASRLTDELTAMQAMHDATRALMPDAAIARPPLQLVVTCGPGGAGASGFAPGRLLSIVFLSCTRAASDVAVREEVLRHLIERSFENPPLWLSAGVARYVAAATDGGEAAGGYPQADDTVTLRAPWMPVRSVFSATRESPEWRDRQLRRRFVAQAALYVAYWRSRQPHGDLSRAVLDRARLGPAEALTHALGLDLDVFATEAERYFREGTLQHVRLRGDAEAIGCVRRAEAGEVAALRIHGLINQDRPSEARALFDAASGAQDASPDLRTAGARLLSAEGRRTEAIAAFARLAGAETGSPQPRRFFAEALLDPGAGGAAVVPSDAERAEGLLNESLDDAPADVYDLLARAALARGDAASAALDALEAFARWPRHEFALRAAEAYLTTGNRAAAAAMLAPLAQAGESAEIRTSAATLLKRLGSVDDAASKPLPRLRRLHTGDRTTAGRFLGVECGEAWTFVRLSANGREQRYAVTHLELLDIRSYRAATVQPVRCDGRREPEDVRVTWRREDTTPAAADGVAVALEFLP